MDSTIHNLASSSSEYIRIISEYYNYNVSEYVLNDLIVYLSTNQNHQKIQKQVMCDIVLQWACMG